MSCVLAAARSGAPTSSSKGFVGILHGLLGSKQNWRTITRQLDPQLTCVAMDARNHGESPHRPSMAYEEMATDAAATMSSEMGHTAPFSLVGHSMGGKTAMHLALTQPSLVSRLVVVDIAPTTYSWKDRLDHNTDFTDASKDSIPYIFNSLKTLQDLSAFRTRKEVDVALEKLIPDFGVRQFLLTNLRTSHHLHWGIPLDVLRASLPSVASFPSHDGSVFDKPALFVYGTRSHHLVPSRDTETIQRLFPQAHFHAFDTGHWVHVEAGAKFVNLVSDFLKK